jgi:hypothetical protein
MRLSAARGSCSRHCTISKRKVVFLLLRSKLPYSVSRQCPPDRVGAGFPRERAFQVQRLVLNGNANWEFFTIQLEGKNGRCHWRGRRARRRHCGRPGSCGRESSNSSFRLTEDFRPTAECKDALVQLGKIVHTTARNRIALSTPYRGMPNQTASYSETGPFIAARSDPSAQWSRLDHRDSVSSNQRSMRRSRNPHARSACSAFSGREPMDVWFYSQRPNTPS